MYQIRRWSVRHAHWLEALYQLFLGAFLGLAPLWRVLGLKRLERPVAVLERATKGLLFDCRMCGQCALIDTGMSCPMNCPKSIRNGPCGGVRADGTCEIAPSMACVWVEAWAGSRLMRYGDITEIKSPLDYSKFGCSSWLALIPKKKPLE